MVSLTEQTNRIGVSQNLRPNAIFPILFVLLFLVMLAAVGVGPVRLGPEMIWQTLVGQGTLASETILFQIRAPRMVLGLCVGASLGICGASLQGLLRNPLADPGLIGITAGASLAVVLTIVLGDQLFAALPAPIMAFILPIMAFLGALGATGIVLATARLGGTFSVGRLILVGVAITAIAGAIIGLLVYLSTDQQLRELTFWTMGSLAKSNWTTVTISSAVMVIGSLALVSYARALDLFQIGERAAFHSGLDVARVKFRICAISAVAVGAGVAVAGPVGFIGLVAPHIARLLGFAAHRFVLPLSAMIGAILLILADLFVRNIIPPSELPIGIATGSLGGPFFLWLLMRNKRL